MAFKHLPQLFIDLNILFAHRSKDRPCESLHLADNALGFARPDIDV